MKAIYKRELRSYFTGIIGYLFIFFVLLFAGIYVTALSFSNSFLSDIVYTLSNVLFVVIFIMPVLTMRMFAEEKQNKTDQLLYSLPVSVTETVLAKFFAAATVYGMTVAFICIYPIVFSAFGNVNLLFAYGSIFAFFLAGLTLISVGMFISSLVSKQIVAIVITLASMLLILLMSSLATLIPTTPIASFIAFTVVIVLFGGLVYLLVKNYLVSLASAAILEAILAVVFLLKKDSFGGLFAKVLGWFTIFEKFDSFSLGMFDLSSVIYYLSFTALFVFFTVQSVEKRRWS